MDRVTREVRRLSDELFRATGVQLTALAMRAGPSAQWQNSTNFAPDINSGNAVSMQPPPPATQSPPDTSIIIRESPRTPGLENRIRDEDRTRESDRERDHHSERERDRSRERDRPTNRERHRERNRDGARNEGTDQERERDRDRNRVRERNRYRDRNREMSRHRPRSPLYRTPESDNDGSGGWWRLRLWSEENLQRIRDLRDLHNIIDRRLERVLRERDSREFQYSNHGRGRNNRSHRHNSHTMSSNHEDPRHCNSSRRRSRERSTHRSHDRHRRRRRHRSSNRRRNRSPEESVNETIHCQSEAHTGTSTAENGGEVGQPVEAELIHIQDDEGPLPDYPTAGFFSEIIPNAPTVDEETQSADSGSVNSN